MKITVVQQEVLAKIVKIGRKQIAKGQFTPMRGTLREAMGTFKRRSTRQK